MKNIFLILLAAVGGFILGYECGQIPPRVKYKPSGQSPITTSNDTFVIQWMFSPMTENWVNEGSHYRKAWDAPYVDSSIVLGLRSDGVVIWGTNAWQSLK